VLTRFLKFGAVGATGVGINMAVFWLLSTALPVHYLIASACAIELALCSNYLLNHNWTFADRSAGRADKKQFAQYHAVSFGGMLINLAVLQLLVGLFGVLPVVANLCGIAAGTTWNFAINVHWTWRKTPAVLLATE
jgi:dolichol-phosphate mannosyltransferase